MATWLYPVTARDCTELVSVMWPSAIRPNYMMLFYLFSTNIFHTRNRRMLGETNYRDGTTRSLRR